MADRESGTAEVVLVDAEDRPLGTLEKLAAHQQGALHRALSVYLFNSAGELLMQRRAADKYHCGGLWGNSCCSHPLPGEPVAQAAVRRVREELGLDCVLTPLCQLSYRAPVTNGLIEHEYLHVFVGYTDEPPQLAPEEADAWRYESLPDLTRALAETPEVYVPWLAPVLPAVRQALFRG